MDIFKYWLLKKSESDWILRALTDKSYKHYFQEKNGLEYRGEINTELATYGDTLIKFLLSEILLDKVSNITESKKKYESDENFVLIIGKHYDILNYLNYDKNDKNMPKNYNYWLGKEGNHNTYKFIATAVEAMVGAIYKETNDLNGIKILLKYWINLTDRGE